MQTPSTGKAASEPGGLQAGGPVVGLDRELVGGGWSGGDGLAVSKQVGWWPVRVMTLVRAMTAGR